MHLFEANDHAEQNNSLYAPRWAIRLSHVSSHWRKVAMECSRLWTYANLAWFIDNPLSSRSQGAATPTTFDIDRKRIEQWISRSGNRPLHLQIHFAVNSLANIAAGILHSGSKLHDIGIPFERLRSLRIIVSRRGVHSLIALDHQSFLPNLQELEIIVGATGMRATTQGLGLKWTLPSLRRFALFDRRLHEFETPPIAILKGAGNSLEEVEIKGGNLSQESLDALFASCSHLRRIALLGVCLISDEMQHTVAISSVEELEMGQISGVLTGHNRDQVRGIGDATIATLVRIYTFANLRILRLHLQTIGMETARNLRVMVSRFGTRSFYCLLHRCVISYEVTDAFLHAIAATI